MKAGHLSIYARSVSENFTPWIERLNTMADQKSYRHIIFRITAWSDISALQPLSEEKMGRGQMFYSVIVSFVRSVEEKGSDFSPLLFV